MAKNLLIVESPAKAKTIKKYLGTDFEVLASYGHVRDLVPKNGAVDPEHNFAMKYTIVEKNATHIAAIVKALKQAEVLYLATDPDREGEAIAWHVYELMQAKKALKKQPVHRVVFHEITKTAIIDAVSHPRTIAMELVDAQQARRALDYLVGFNLSPLLWKKIRYGLSAGRVQSPALRMIVAREEEIAKFAAREYWSITAQNCFCKQQFAAKLMVYQGEKLTQFSLTSAEQVATIREQLLMLAEHKLSVVKVEKKQRRRHPAPPFTTSTLQQEASRKLGFTAKRTMSTAQRLYEAGYITYMRTDSVNLAQEAIAEIRETIAQRFGQESLPAEPNFYRTKSKLAQEAHEAIRPTASKNTPELLASKLTAEQLKLYTLIWKRTIAAQMIDAILNQMTVDLACGSADNLFRATGSQIDVPGFLNVYFEGSDEQTDDENKTNLPDLKVNDQVDLLDLVTEQHFTEPQPRYSEASLVKALEEYGIGRPSTYAAIIDTLLTRNYVVLENKRFKPTDVGVVVNKFLVNYFTKYVDYEFTAHLEDELDEIAAGKGSFLKVMQDFWEPFQTLVTQITSTVKRSDVTQEQLTEKCPKCGKALTMRLGKKGRFIGCSGYPECDYTANLDTEQKPQAVEVIPDRVCPECGAVLQIKQGRYGKFIGCSNYPQCKFMEPLEKPQDTAISCPVCHQGTLVRRKSRYGKYFYSCSQYPQCKYAVWHEPINKACPKCGWPIVTQKETKRRGKEHVCPQKDCGWCEQV